MELNLVMLGPPGAGKGTQARQLRKRWDIPHISTGAMLREAVQSATPLGREVGAIMESGGLIDDDVITKVVNERLQQQDARVGFLLDGFPRTIPQARSLDALVTNRAPLVIVEIVLTEAEVVRRLASRMVCAECGTNAQDTGESASCHDCGGPLVPRADDREQVVLNRLEVYRNQTEPLVKYYGQRPTFCRIDGAQLPDDVTADIIKAVESKEMIRVIRLGTPRARGEGLRLGTVRLLPRGVKKQDFAKRDYFDLWLPEVSPSAGLVSWALSQPWTDKRWATFARRYHSEMRKPAAQRLIALLAAVSSTTNFSIGCYCENPLRCHRSLLGELLQERGADVSRGFS